MRRSGPLIGLLLVWPWVAWLDRVRSASGANYETDGLVIWTKGDEALVEIVGESYRGCRRSKRDAPG